MFVIIKSRENRCMLISVCVIKNFRVLWVLPFDSPPLPPHILCHLFASHTPQQVRNTTYPVARAIQLVMAISRDVASRLFDVLRSLNLMKLRYVS